MSADPRTVLLIANSPDDRATYRYYLERNRETAYCIWEAETGGDAVRICQNLVPDLILLDTSLPDVDGLQLLDRLQDRLQGRRSAIVLLADADNGDIAVRALQRGVFECIYKNCVVENCFSEAAFHHIIKLASERTALQTQINRDRDRQRLVSEMALRIRSSLDLDTILEAATTEIRACLDCDRVLVYRFDANWGGYVVAESVGDGWEASLGQSIQDTCFTDNPEIVAAYATGKHFVTANIYEAGLSECHLQLLDRFSVKANLVVPILYPQSDDRSKPQLWGLLVAHQCSRYRQWKESEVQLLDELAGQLAIAVDLATLVQQLRTKNRALQQAQERLELALEGSYEGIFDWNLKTNEIYLSDGFKRLLGYDREEIDDRLEAWQDTIDPDDRDTVQAALSDYLERRTPNLQIEYRARHKDGFLCWILLRGTAARDETGTPYRLVGSVTEITERKQIESALWLAQSTLDRAGDQIFLVTESGRFFYVNEAACQALNYARTELWDLSISDIVPAFSPVQWREHWQALQQQQVLNFETVYCRKGGLEIPVEVSSSYLEFNGKAYNCTIVRDISDLKTKERILRNSEARFRSAFDDAAIGMALVSLQGRFTKVNRSLCEITGYSEPELLSKTFVDITHPDDLDSDMNYVRQMLAGEIRTYQLEKRYITRSEQTVWVLLSISIVRDEREHPLYFIAQIQNIDDRKRTEKALRESEERFSLTLEGINDGIWDWDITSDRVYYSPGWKKMIGYEDNELANHFETWKNLVHPDDRERALARLKTYLDGQEQSYTVEHRLRHKNGSYRWILSRGTALRDAEGRVYRMLGSHTDISDRKAIETELLQVSQLQKAILDSASYSIISTDANGIIQTFNAEAERLLGYSALEVVGRVTPAIVHDRDEVERRAKMLSAELGYPVEAGFETFVAKAKTGKIDESEWTYICKDGTRFPVLLSVSTLRDENGDITGFVGVGRDITQRKRTEASLQKRDRYLSALIEIQSVLLAEETNPDSQILPILGDAFGASRVGIFKNLRAENDRPAVQLRSEWCASTVRPVIESPEFQNLPYDCFPGSYETLSSGEVLHRKVSELPPSQRQILDPFDLANIVMFPLFIKEEFWGFIAVDNCWQDKEWSHLEIDLLSTAASTLALAKERKRDRIALQRSNDRLQAVLNAMPGLMSWVAKSDDNSLKYIGVNQHLAASFDRAPEEFVGQPVGFLGRTDSRFSGFIEQVFLEENTYAAKEISIGTGAEKRYYSMAGQKYDRGSAAVLIGIDISDRKAAEASLAQRDYYLNTLVEIQRQLLSSALDDDTYSIILSILGLATEADRIYIFTSYGDELRVRADWRSGEIDPVNDNPLWPHLPYENWFDRWFECLQNSEAINGAIDEFPPMEQRILKAFGIGSVLVLPLTVGDKFLGFIAFDRAGKTAWNALEANLLRSVASAVAAARQAQLNQEELQRQFAAIEAASDGIAVIDRDGDYIYLNPAYLQLFGYSQPEELIGNHWKNIYPPEERDRLERDILPIVIQQGYWAGEATAVRQDGSTFARGLSLTIAQNGELVCVCRDITQRKQAEEQLRRTNAELERATKLKDEFLANMSHELRTPLNAIIGISEALQEEVYGPLTEKQQRSLGTVEKSGQHLLQLINEILDLSKIESGKMELQPTSISARSLCNSSLAFVKELANKKQVVLSLDLSETDFSFVADERRMRQVLVNLLNNAVKFTPEGGRVTLRARKQLSDLTVLFAVEDTGIGIPADKIDTLFEAFVQIDSSLSRRYEGTGLGLPLVKRIAELHGGTVTVETEVDRGSTFTVSLPQTTGDRPEASIETPSQPCLSCDLAATLNSQALIVEDSPPASEQIARYLEEEGLKSAIYSQGKGAIDLALRLKPGVIVLDLQLPDCSGWEVLAQLKTHPKTQHIPILVVTIVDDRPRGIAMGASEYLVKPISREQFRGALEKICTIQQQTALVVSPQNEPENLAGPLILIAEDNEANIETLSDYLTLKGYRLMFASNGIDAIAFAKEHRPDVILMDVQMPEMDGLEATRCIRQDADIASIPIIALTALAMEGDRDRCLAAGANEYISKPVSLKQLTQLIETQLRCS